MSTDTGARYEGQQVRQTIQLYADIGASDVLKPGMPLCYKTDSATASERYSRLAKPSLANINDYAGFVVTGRVGPGMVDIEPYDGTIARGVSVYTDESVTAGDLLGPVPGTYTFGYCVIGRPVFRATETVDRSTTAGLVVGDSGMGNLSEADIGKKCIRFFDHFVNAGMVAGVANLHDYELVGTGSTFTGGDALAIAATDTTPDGTKSGPGVGLITTATTGWLANVALPGEPFSLDANKSLFFRARVALASTTTAQMFIGLGTAAVTDAIDTGDTDGIGFRILATVLSFVYAKDATPSVIETLTGWTAQAISSPAIAADVFVDLAFLVRNRNGTKEVSIFVNDTQIAHTTVPDDVVDNESLTLRLAVGEEGTNAAMTLKVDRLEINNYVG